MLLRTVFTRPVGAAVCTAEEKLLGKGGGVMVAVVMMLLRFLSFRSNYQMYNILGQVIVSTVENKTRLVRHYFILFLDRSLPINRV